MGGKNRNKKVQPYAVFVSEEAKRLGISTQEAFDRCGDTWANMPEHERQRLVVTLLIFTTTNFAEMKSRYWYVRGSSRFLDIRTYIAQNSRSSNT